MFPPSSVKPRFLIIILIFFHVAWPKQFQLKRETTISINSNGIIIIHGNWNHGEHCTSDYLARAFQTRIARVCLAPILRDERNAITVGQDFFPPGHSSCKLSNEQLANKWINRSTEELVEGEQHHSRHFGRWNRFIDVNVRSELMACLARRLPDKSFHCRVSIYRLKHGNGRRASTDLETFGRLTFDVVRSWRSAPSRGLCNLPWATSRSLRRGCHKIRCLMLHGETVELRRSKWTMDSGSVKNTNVYFWRQVCIREIRA